MEYLIFAIVLLLPVVLAALFAATLIFARARLHGGSAVEGIRGSPIESASVGFFAVSFCYNCNFLFGGMVVLFGDPPWYWPEWLRLPAELYFYSPWFYLAATVGVAVCYGLLVGALHAAVLAIPCRG